MTDRSSGVGTSHRSFTSSKRCGQRLVPSPAPPTHRNAKILLRDRKRLLGVPPPILRVELVEVEQLRPVLMYESAPIMSAEYDRHVPDSQRKTIREALLEVLDIHSRVPLRLALTPQQQPIACRETLFPADQCPTMTSVAIYVRDARDGKSQDERPDHAQNELEVAVDDILRSYRQLIMSRRVMSSPMLVSLTPRSRMKLRALDAFCPSAQ